MKFADHRNHTARRASRAGTIAALSLALLATALAAPVAAQTCRDNIDSTAPDSRYDIDSANGTVYDSATRLTWMRCLVGKSGNSCSGTATTMNWGTALKYARDLNAGGGFAGKTDWRLPNAKELGSLVERSCFSPAVNIDAFPGMPSIYYLWSSTQNHFITGDAGINTAWTLHLHDGNDYRKPKSNVYPHVLLLVRDDS